VINQESDIA